MNSTFGHHQKQSGFHPAATNIAPNNPKRNHLETERSCDIYALRYIVFQPSIFRGALLSFGGCNTVDGRNLKQPVEVGRKNSTICRIFTSKRWLFGISSTNNMKVGGKKFSHLDPKFHPQAPIPVPKSMGLFSRVRDLPEPSCETLHLAYKMALKLQTKGYRYDYVRT